MSYLIQLKQLTVKFHDLIALDHINLTLEQRKITTLIGQNGAGKSTLVKVILGLQKPTSGTINKKPKLTVGYVPQKLQLNESLPLDVQRFLNLSKKHTQQESIETLRLVGAEYLLTSNMHQLSGGEIQRVLIARALLHRPQLLVLDEPAQGVDIQGQTDLYNLIDKIRHNFNCAVFIVSHDLHLVMAKTDHVICLQHHICCEGAPADITHNPSYIALFGQETQKTIAFYHHNHRHHHDLSGTPVDGENQECQHHQHGHIPEYKHGNHHD